jgi:hypothetical protein
VHGRPLHAPARNLRSSYRWYPAARPPFRAAPWVGEEPGEPSPYPQGPSPTADGKQARPGGQDRQEGCSPR